MLAIAPISQLGKLRPWKLEPPGGCGASKAEQVSWRYSPAALAGLPHCSRGVGGEACCPASSLMTPVECPPTVSAAWMQSSGLSRFCATVPAAAQTGGWGPLCGDTDWLMAALPDHSQPAAGHCRGQGAGLGHL